MTAHGQGVLMLQCQFLNKVAQKQNEHNCLEMALLTRGTVVSFLALHPTGLSTLR